MIRLESVLVQGLSDAGPFAGELNFSPGLQVVTARNSWGKSLANTAVIWCLGIEAIFGTQDNDPICFPEAAREELQLVGDKVAKVISSECSITLVHQDGRRLTLARAIKGDPRNISVEEWAADGSARKSSLVARRETMQDEHGGFQRFFFNWIGWPRQEVTTYRSGLAEIYLENVAPLFYIDQDEGWTNIQALQIGRYGQQQISEIAVEYLLGAVDAIKLRIAKSLSAHRNAVLREEARAVAGRIENALLKRGWQISWSGNGSLSDIVARWSSRKIRDILLEDARVDLNATHDLLTGRIESLRRKLTRDPVDPQDISAPAKASQRVVQLKQERHDYILELNTLRRQQQETSDLLASLEHRIQAASDLLRLKVSGVGRLSHVECPTCHRDLDPATFALTQQSTDSVEAHIEGLKRDRDLISRSSSSLTDSLVAIQAALGKTDAELREAESALLTVTSAIGTVREQIAQIAAELTTAERDLERVRESQDEIRELQDAVDNWVKTAHEVADTPSLPKDIANRRQSFVTALQRYLVALGHSAVTNATVTSVIIDEQYTPYLNQRRLRSLGSASDQSRLIAAYSLALAASSNHVAGFHPGIVILDEPLQQNPDKQHRDLFLAFLTKELAQTAKFQTIIFTWLQDAEIEILRKEGTTLIVPKGPHFLRLLPSDSSKPQLESPSGKE